MTTLNSTIKGSGVFSTRPCPTPVRFIAPRQSIGRFCRPVILAQSNGSVSFRASADSSTGNVAAPPKPAEARPPLLAAPANYENVVAIGTAQASQPPGKIFLLGIQAGFYIAIAGFVFLSIGGNMPGLAASNPGLQKLVFSLVFPVGLLMVILSGSQLYTGNTALVTCALLEGKISFGQLVKNFFFSYIGNLVGSLLIVAAVSASGSLSGNAMPVAVATAKASLPVGVAVIRGVLANWLVCVAVFQAASASTMSGKAIGLWLPIAAFVAVGLEHSVANMFIIPMGMALGAKVTVSDFIFNNLLPVTVGNTLAGVLLMALMYCACFGSLSKKLFPAPK